MTLTLAEPLRLTAPAKVNLALHVVGRRPDGYHRLESLIAFAGDACDVLTVAAAPEGADRLVMAGPFGASLPTDADNILHRTIAVARQVLAHAGLRLPPLTLTLDKRLPVAAGIGGGSADAAALLRMIGDAVPAVRDALLARATTLGADVPMCIAGRAARVSGIGEKIKPLANLPALHMLLVNPGVPVSTPAVFAALEQRDNAPLPPVPAQGFRTAAELVAWLDGTRNDLAAPAERLAPQIVAVRDALAGDGALIARMSGSGATVYGLFEDDARLARARSRIAASHPEWWLSGARHPATPADLTLEAP
ncbi:4-diphosphocytidyl-2-C-methyl-D-erythritol kinase [Aurantimonas manganoxydans SI85-9A1]|uniref:4-diphosphocytidyl-2-C-methyl-D-erythritol kinase n=1 Tax=Aurantimonas manganoxydans (strain ATCC BAA-1229 / DSM 21871 / SI85-9A1) TaxID=287752 RepID=Q1YGI7_AURMS|nr:4-(cytidine 5'-diphospho)-2-C-methyl-D-erythritol kinase [Aurantimonas manganoxydans]EAS49238.1 4-diphosphocytidyl-2-C-methyl-D-erythritol kinase [Aurantimonas manganoxydans SI85-9A1]